MSDTLEVITPVQSRPIAEDQNTRPSRLWPRLGLGGVMLVSIFSTNIQSSGSCTMSIDRFSALRQVMMIGGGAEEIMKELAARQLGV